MIAETLISGALGGVLGLAQKWLDLKAEKAKAEEAEKVRAHELAVMEKENQYALDRIAAEERVAETESAGRAFEASQRYGNESLLPKDVKLTASQTWWLVVVEAISRAIRPVTTIYYQLAVAGVFGWAAWTLAQTNNLALSPETASKIIVDTVETVLYLSAMTVGWWYGVSPTRKKR